MENSRRFLPERKNRGNRMSELAKDEGKMLEDDKYGIFKEDSSDDDFNPDDVKNAHNSSSEEENEEGEEEEDSNEEDISEEESEKKEIKPSKKSKKEETILDIDQLDIDKIDMIEDLKDRGIDISDEEELEKRMREYNEESEKEEEEQKVVVIKKKRGRKSKKELEMMHKKRGRKKKVVENDDNIFLQKQPPSTEVNYGKIIIENTENIENNNNNNNIDINEDEKELKIQSAKSSKIKKSKKEKINKDLGIDPDQYFTDIANSSNNPNIIIDDNNFVITLYKKCLIESIPELSYVPPTKLDYIELNNNNFENSLSPNKRKYKKNLISKSDEKNIKYNNSGIIQINNNNIIINKKLRNTTTNDNISNEKLDTNTDIIGHKRTRYENNLIDLFKKSKKEKPNKNVTIVGNRENPRYIYISKKIFDENDEEKEIRKEEKKKKKKEREKDKDKEDEKENERLNFNLEQEMDTKNIIMKYKQQEKEKKQFGIQNKVISQEQRLFESIFTELTNKQSLKTMQKLEDLNKRENYLYTSKKAFKDFVKITNSERHILDEKANNQNQNQNQNIIIENDNNNKNINIENNINNININNNEEKKEEIKEEKIKNDDNININNVEEKLKINNENENENNENRENVENVENKDIKDIKDDIKDIKDDKQLEEEYKEKEKKLNKVRVTFTNKEYFRIFNNLNKKPIKDKKEKLCAITGKPAKYFDPLTKNYYSTVEAFKILRERYYQKEEDCLLFKIQTLSDLASQKKRKT